jgi:hypothetical protein
MRYRMLRCLLILVVFLFPHSVVITAPDYGVLFLKAIRIADERSLRDMEQERQQRLAHERQVAAKNTWPRWLLQFTPLVVGALVTSTVCAAVLDQGK